MCGSPAVDPADQLSITNPSVLVEVLSPSTAAYDTTDKLIDYQRIPALLHVVHVHHDAPRIEVYTRRESGFERHEYRAAQTARLELLDIALAVDDLYFDPLTART